jgi:hypothetical protein
MTPKPAIFDVYRVRIDCSEPKFKSWVCKIPATSERHAVSLVREKLDEARTFNLAVIPS